MSIERDSINKNLHLRLDHNPRIDGLQKFRKILEREYFSDVTVRNCALEPQSINLIIELDSPYGLIEMHQHLMEGNLGRTQNDPFTGLPISPLDSSLFELQLLNDQLVDVEEFSIFLADCTIVIKKIYPQSIQEQLANIFNSFRDHFIPMTQEYTRIPNEIYIPVFEGDLSENELVLTRIEQANNNIKDYFNYWGLYFDYQEDAAIYELEKKSIFNGDLYMLNH
ncbi:MAG: hypothetical protein ABF293_00220 [Flavobacteriaceae bacterium]